MPFMKRDTKGRPAFTRRAALIGLGQLGIFGAIATRLYKLQVTEHSKYATLAQANSISERLVAPERGLITDRFGVILAGNQQHWRALFMAAQAPDVQTVLDNFSKLVPLSDDERSRIMADLGDRPQYIPVMLKDFLEPGLSVWDGARAYRRVCGAAEPARGAEEFGPGAAGDADRPDRRGGGAG
jgi:penicillin-binding protein 2